MERLTVRVISASRLDAETVKKIETVFSKKHNGEKTGFTYDINPALLGGLLIIDGKDYYDSTFKSALNKIKKTLI